MIKWIILGAVFVFAFLALRALEQRTLYFPDSQLFAYPSALRLSYEDAFLTTMDGVKIHGWFIPAVQAPPAALRDHAYAVLFCHGNAGNVSHRLDKVSRLRTLGQDWFLLDYRGYGKSEGTPSEQGTYADAEAAYRYLIEKRGMSPSRVVFYGESLGCAVAVEMAKRHPAAGLILESPFTSSVDMGKKFFPWLPVRWVTRYRYDNLSKMAAIQCPLLILHSPKDDIIPFEMGKRLFEAARPPKRFVELIGDHNEGYIDSGDVYPNALREFFLTLKETSHEKRPSHR